MRARGWHIRCFGFVITSVQLRCGLSMPSRHCRRDLRKDCAVKKTFLPLGIALFLLVTPSLAAAFSGEPDVTPLNNKDVLQMVQSHLSAEAIVNTIKASPCTFDTFPPVLRDMKRRGVPDQVLQA